MKGSLLFTLHIHEYRTDIVRHIHVPERSEMVRIVLYLYLGSLQLSTQSMLCKMHFEPRGSAIVIALEPTVYGGFRIAREL